MVYFTCSSVDAKSFGKVEASNWYRLERPSAACNFENEAQFSFKRRWQLPANFIEQERQCGLVIGTRLRKAAVRSLDPTLEPFDRKCRYERVPVRACLQI